MSSIEDYASISGEDVISHLRQLAEPLKGMKVVHVNSTRVGGGVAEILTKLVPLMAELGIDVHWEVVRGEDAFFHCTKSFHNALQGTQSTSFASHVQSVRGNQRGQCRGTPAEA